MKRTLVCALLALAGVTTFAQTSPSTAASAGIPGTRPASGAADKADANVQKRTDKKAHMDHAKKAPRAASSASDAAANAGK
jgi:hypothetical protein